MNFICFLLFHANTYQVYVPLFSSMCYLHLFIFYGFTSISFFISFNNYPITVSPYLMHCAKVAEWDATTTMLDTPGIDFDFVSN